MVPMAMSAPRSALRGAGLMELNVLKEYCEEIFSRDDLVDERNLRILDPVWIGEYPEAGELSDQIADGRATLRYLGLGFDGLNGNPTIAVALHFHSSDSLERLTARARGNWEVDGGAGKGLEIVPLEAIAIGPLIQGRALTYGSAFALVRALQVLGPTKVDQERESSSA
jgi:hypothetical protein